MATVTLNDFVVAALEYIDAHGAATLTAISLGQAMHLHPTAIYRHLKSMEDLLGILQQSKVDQKVTLTIVRAGKQMEVTATLAARPANP